MNLEILYEDNHLIAVNKPVGVLVQGDKTGDKTLLNQVKEYIKVKYNKPGDVYIGLVHRIDRPASGVVIFAKTSKALSRINEQLRNHEIKRTYWAVVKTRPKELQGTLIHYIKKNEEKNKSYASDVKKKNSKKAELSYELIGGLTNYFLLQVELKTGRHHQIRCQLAKIGCPIKGDLKYGFSRSNRDGGIHLHAKKIELIHPVKKEKIVIEAPVPNNDNIWREFKQLQ